MTVLAHRVTYQGYKCRTVKFRRTEGLSPETGYVDINISDLGSIKITMPQIPWRNPNKARVEVPGQLDIGSAFRLYKQITSGAGQTVTGVEEKPSAGLNMVGDLVLETFDSGNSMGKVTYVDTYVAFEGIEEITEKLAYAKKHNQGFVRIPLSDIRQFYSDNGLLFQNINCRLRSALYDPRTVKEGGEPWSLVEVLQFLFSQLPGSPTINKKSVIFGMGGNPPSEIVGEGEPVVGFIQDILTQFGLVAKFQPGGDYLITKRWEDEIKPGNIARSPGSPSKWPYLKTEKRSCNGVKRPPLVCVKGRRRVQRVTIPYVAVIQWTDGRYYQLDDIGALVPGYDINMVNLQVLNNEGKNFQDILPFAPSGKQGYQWMQILRKQAYKVYAPASIFSEIPFVQPKSSGTASVPGRSKPAPATIHVIDDEDVKFIPFLPVVDAPWYKGDLKLDGLDMMFKGVSSKKSSGGDFDEVVLLPPVVKSRTIGEMWFQDSVELDRHFQRVAESYGKEHEYFLERIRICEDRAASFVEHINACNRNAKNILRMQGVSSNPLPVVEIDAETRAQAREFGKFDDDVKKVADDMGNGVPATFTILAIKKELAEWKESEKQARKVLKQHLEQILVYKSVYANYRGFMGIGNLPTKICESGKYSINRNNGVITFAEPQCVGQSALVMSDEWQRVVDDGAVSVSFGYELRFNSVSDWTTVYVAPKPTSPGKSAKAALSGYSRASGIKASLERMPDVTLYLDEFGEPMNLTFVTDAALRKAQFQVAQPDAVTGYHSIYHGFAPCVLDAGINCVQHEWDGGKTAPMTHVYQNYPGGEGPLGPAMVPTQSAAEGRVRQRAAAKELQER